MSADGHARVAIGRGLGKYIVALLDELGAADPAALARMRQIVGERRARIKLDDEAVDVFFDLTSLHVRPAAPDSAVNGVGEMESATVFALLDGNLEVGSAILNGQLRVSGESEDIARMFVAIEILLDASPRTPPLQILAAQFRHERRASSSKLSVLQTRTPWYPFSSSDREIELLSDHDLLPHETLSS